MSNLFGVGRRKPSSGQVAKERLKLVLVHDRSGLSPQQLDALKDEILKIIARYVDIDHEHVEINLTQNQRESRLQANIPIRAATRRKRRPAESSAAPPKREEIGSRSTDTDEQKTDTIKRSSTDTDEQKSGETKQEKA